MGYKVIATFADWDDMEKLSALASHYCQNESVVSGQIIKTESSKAYLVHTETWFTPKAMRP